MTARPARQDHLATSIDEVIEQMDEIIARARSQNSRMGYFASLYRNVTIEVRRGISQGRFEDGPRMERLDVNFANRYLFAVDCHGRGEPVSKCWAAAFKAVPEWPPIVLQHLLLGMNAHINLDLAAAAAITCPGDKLPPLRHDFDEINNILAAMVGGVRWRLSQISRWMKLLNRVWVGEQDKIIYFSMDEARAAAWNMAERLAPLSPEQMEVELDQLDQNVTLLAKLIRNPGILISAGNLIVRFSEPRQVTRIIDILS